MLALFESIRTKTNFQYRIFDLRCTMVRPNQQGQSLALCLSVIPISGSRPLAKHFTECDQVLSDGSELYYFPQPISPHRLSRIVLDSLTKTDTWRPATFSGGDGVYWVRGQAVIDGRTVGVWMFAKPLQRVAA